MAVGIPGRKYKDFFIKIIFLFAILLLLLLTAFKQNDEHFKVYIVYYSSYIKNI